jgi:sugar phosphate isomerase/epimerase
LLDSKSASPIKSFSSVDGDPADVDAVARLAHDTGLTISGMLAGPLGHLPPTSNDESARVEARRIARRAIEVASTLGVDALLAVVPGRVEADVPYGVASERAVAFVRDLVPGAEAPRCPPRHRKPVEPDDLHAD